MFPSIMMNSKQAHTLGNAVQVAVHFVEYSKNVFTCLQCSRGNGM